MLYTSIMWVSSRFHPHSSSISFCAINSYTSKNKIKIIMGTTTDTYLRFNGGRLILLFRSQSYSGHVWCKFVQVLRSHIGNKYCICTRVKAHRISLRRLGSMCTQVLGTHKFFGCLGVRFSFRIFAVDTKFIKCA